jgi:hypothetical protein
VTRRDALEFARGMFGEEGAVLRAGAVQPCGIGVKRSVGIIVLEWGSTWCAAAEAVMREVESSCLYGWEPWETPF